MKPYKNTNNRILPLDTVNVSFKSTERWTHKEVTDILKAYSNSLGYGFSVNYKEKRYSITTDKATITLFYNDYWPTFVMSFSVPKVICGINGKYITHAQLRTLYKEINPIIQYFNRYITLDDCKVSRADIGYNIPCATEEEKQAYIEFFKSAEVRYMAKDNQYKTSAIAMNKSHRLIVYDKNKEAGNKNTFENTLRIEYQLKKSRLERKYPKLKFGKLVNEAYKMFRDFWNKEEFSLKILDRVSFFQKVRKIFKTKRRKCTFDVEYFFAHLNIEGVKETKKVFGKSKVYRYKAILKKHGICPYYLEIAEMVTKLEFPKYISYHIRLPRKNRKQYKPVRLNNIIYIKVAFNLLC